MNTATIVLVVLLAIALLALLFLRGGKRGASAAPRATTESAPAPAEAATATPSPFLDAPAGAADDLTRIKGIGPKIAARLGELGVYHYAQIAGWTDAQLALVDHQLGAFEGRATRDRWREQAALLATGDRKTFERLHGKLGDAPRPAANGDGNGAAADNSGG